MIKSGDLTARGLLELGGHPSTFDKLRVGDCRASPEAQAEMKNRVRFTRKERGSALMSSLALTAVLALTMSGISLLATSHANLQRTDGDYALSMQIAEAGINYELNYMSVNHTTCPTTSTSMPGAVGSFSVSATNADGSAWTSPNPAIITASGTVRNVTRKIQVSADFAKLPLFAANAVVYAASGTQDTASYGVFGVKNVSISGSANCVYGNVGSNNTISLSGDGETKGYGVAVACGPSAMILNGGNLPSTRRTTTTTPMAYPAVSTLAAQKFTNGFTTLSSVAQLLAQAGRIRRFVGTSSYTLSPSNTTLANWPIIGTGATTLNHTFVSSLPNSSIILTPGDYYLTNLTLQTQDNLILDCQNLSTGGPPGQINIWMAGNTTNDSFAASCAGVSNDPKMFRIYYGKSATISVTADSHIQGGIYAVAVGSGTGTGATVSLSGNANYTYAVLADNVTMASGTQVSLINNTGDGGISNPAVDPMIQSAFGVNIGFTGQWQELVAAGRSRVFADGSNN